MPLKLDEHNEEVKAWGKEATALFKGTARAMGVKHVGNSPSPSPSVNKFKNRYRSKDGAIERISFSFPRSLIYPHKGAGKGMGGVKGSRWVDKHGKKKTTNPKSFGKMDSGGRRAKEFINEVLDGGSGVNKLADIVAENLGDSIVADLFV